MDVRAALTRLIERKDLDAAEMRAVMHQIMGGEMTPVQIAGVIVALRCKGETVTEIAAGAEVMRELALKVPADPDEHLVDTCGTGGDAAHTFNVSTCAALVAAAAGVKVAKHGGRSVSSTCGSADVLEALGVNLQLAPEQVAECIAEVGLGFMFAPSHHGAMKHAAPVRRELGVRTLFNVLGPMTNPAGARNQVMGVFDRALTGKLAQALKALGSRHVMVVHGDDGLDEISVSGATQVAELRDGAIAEYALSPRRFGLRESELAEIRVLNRDEACAMLRGVLDNRPGAARDIVMLNAGAAIYVGGGAASLEEGVAKADAAIASGAARARLDQLVAFTRGRAAA